MIKVGSYFSDEKKKKIIKVYKVLNNTYCNMENIGIEKEKKGSYLLYSDQNEIIFDIPGLKTPFGIEEYNNKRVINLEFTNMEGDNDIRNLFCQLSGYEENFQKNIEELKHIDDFDLCENFVSSIRKNGKFDPLIRVHITDDSEIPLSGCPAKSKVCGKIRLKKLWTWKDKWGMWMDVINLEIKND
ncbi:hypothetical protein CPAV1605_780 [seawater metagenome]|uniref:Uncharacterized protein n=1 Tax=seawater metagenome TaxID=1561972 RepID=A0A5E8CLL9_9ZZZZ